MAFPRADLNRRLLKEQLNSVDQTYNEVAERLGRRDAGRVWRKATTNVFRQIIAEARSLAPKRSGYLRRRIDAKPARRRRRDFYAIRFGYLAVRNFRQALAQEFGNRRTRKQAAIYPTWEKNQQELMNSIVKSLRNELLTVEKELTQKLKRR